MLNKEIEEADFWEKFFVSNLEKIRKFKVSENLEYFHE